MKGLMMLNTKQQNAQVLYITQRNLKKHMFGFYKLVLKKKDVFHKYY
jgi:hypothetical protein